MAAKGDVSQVQLQIQQDWANREYIEVITCSIKKIADFLNSFGKLGNGDGPTNVAILRPS